MSTKLLRDQLIGAWQLVRYTERDVETGAENFPLGEHPLGLVLYAPDGYMSAQLQSANRAPFAEGDPLRATPEEYAAAGRSHVAYSFGRFFVDEAKQSLSHEMALSFFPNWFGQRQIRLVKIDGDVLHLSTDGPQRFNDALKTATLTWKRAKRN